MDFGFSILAIMAILSDDPMPDTLMPDELASLSIFVARGGLWVFNSGNYGNLGNYGNSSDDPIANGHQALSPSYRSP